MMLLRSDLAILFVVFFGKLLPSFNNFCFSFVLTVLDCVLLVYSWLQNRNG